MGQLGGQAGNGRHHSGPPTRVRASTHAHTLCPAPSSKTRTCCDEFRARRLKGHAPKRNAAPRAGPPRRAIPAYTRTQSPTGTANATANAAGQAAGRAGFCQASHHRRRGTNCQSGSGMLTADSMGRQWRGPTSTHACAPSTQCTRPHLRHVHSSTGRQQGPQRHRGGVRRQRRPRHTPAATTGEAHAAAVRVVAAHPGGEHGVGPPQLAQQAVVLGAGVNVRVGGKHGGDAVRKAGPQEGADVGQRQLGSQGAQQGQRGALRRGGGSRPRRWMPRRGVGRGVGRVGRGVGRGGGKDTSSTPALCDSDAG